MTDSTRRRLLCATTALAAGAAAWPLVSCRRRDEDDRATSRASADPSHASTAPAPFQQPLRLPGRDGLLAEVALTAPLTLRAQRGDFAVLEGGATQVWHYAATVDGRSVANPLLRVARGAELDVTLVNALDQDTTIHWHGFLVDEANDGSGLHPVAPGARTAYRFRVGNRAGLYWYHAHPHRRTGLQLHRGLAAPLLVEDAEEHALRERLGLRWGERDIPLFIADKQIGPGNAIEYRLGADDWIGNRVLVNWTPEPRLDVAPSLYRFRLANACNARLLRPAFVHEGRMLPFHLIGTDGGLLAQLQPVEDLFLAPAQRADVLVDFGQVPMGARVILRSLDYVAMENEDESGAFVADPMGDHPGAVPMGAPLDLMQFCVGGCDAAMATSSMRGVLPTTLSRLEPPPDTRGWPVRPLLLRMDTLGRWFINDWNFHRDGHAPVFTVKRGAREVWEIRNSMTSMPHPMHVHGVQFRTVSRSISPHDIRARQVAPGGLGPQDLGWNDTVLVWPGETVRLALDFAQPWSGTQRYMFHCHNLEHEDMGMMLTFAVVD